MSSETSSGTKVLQAWNFDKTDDVYYSLSDALSGANEQHVMLRNAALSSVEYVQLSCLSVLADSQGMSDQKSIGWLETDTKAPLELQLWNFDNAEADKQTSADLIIARRKTETGQELVYLSGITGGGGPSVPGPFEMTLSGQNASFRNCVMRVARAYFFYDDMSCAVPGGDQMVYSVLQHSDTPSVTVSAGPYSDIAGKLGTDWSNLLSTTVTPLYRVISGEVACDYRYMMNVQAYDSRNYSGWVG